MKQFITYINWEHPSFAYSITKIPFTGHYGNFCLYITGLFFKICLAQFFSGAGQGMLHYRFDAIASSDGIKRKVAKALHVTPGTDFSTFSMKFSVLLVNSWYTVLT